MADPKVEQALRDFEATATSFAMRLARTAQVRAAYVEEIRQMSDSIRAAVNSGDLAVEKGASIANEMRNEIMAMQRSRDFDLGRSLAQKWKSQGLTLEEAIGAAMNKLGAAGRPFKSLSGEQQAAVFREVIDAAGRSRPSVTRAIPRLRGAARGLWIASLAIAAYNIGTAEDPWWQAGREGANLGGGLVGGFIGGAVIGGEAGVWGGPVGVAVGVVVGGILGALLADHTYVAAVGGSDPLTRAFVKRFTSLWSGTDEDGLAAALVAEHRNDFDFVTRVFRSLEQEYATDADDVAFAYVERVRGDSALQQGLRQNSQLRGLLMQLMDDGWTADDEQQAIRYLRSL